ncbi:hypothetical protein [Lysobacter tyrosinilyticus]
MALRPDTTLPAYPAHEFPRNWSALDLADAIPLRLSERIKLGLVDLDGAPDTANGPFAAPAAPQWRHRGYLRAAALPTYIRVR